jgi:hypothetical protein
MQPEPCPDDYNIARAAHHNRRDDPEYDDFVNQTARYLHNKHNHDGVRTHFHDGWSSAIYDGGRLHNNPVHSTTTLELSSVLPALEPLSSGPVAALYRAVGSDVENPRRLITAGSGRKPGERKKGKQ